MARKGIYPESVKPGIPKLGDKPETWQEVSLGEILSVITRKADIEDDVKYQLVNAKRNREGIAAREVLPGKKILTKTQFYIEHGDFLIANRQIVHGACGVVPKELDGALVSNEYTVLLPINGLLLDFLRYYTHTIYFQQTCFQSSVGVDVEKMIFRLKDWFKYKVHLPPESEQQKIAQILSCWDKAIELTEKLIQAKTKLKKGLMQQLLTGKKRFTNFVSNWEKVKIGNSASTFSGGTPLRTRKEYYNGNIPLIKSGDLHQNEIFHTEEKINEIGLKNSSAKVVKKDTILVALYGATAGVVGISKIEAAINQAILAIIPNNEFHNNYLYYALKKLTIDLLKKVQGSGQPNLNAGIIKSSCIVKPQLSEQQKIASVLSTCDKEIEILNKQLDALKQQKKGLMQKLLTGKVRVKVDPEHAE